MFQTWVLQLILVVTALAERCTKAVPVQTIPSKKVTVLRRVPATCSNWDKAWAWLTKIDCGTKYRLDHVTVPPREVKQYKLEYGCCEGDPDCKEGKSIQTTGFDSTDEKFLAIVLGSTAACVVIVIIIFAITFYTKKSRCHSTCDPDSHTYSSAEVDETQEVETNEKIPPEDIESETDLKGSEAEYAEIGDSRLPRYTDIFKECSEIHGDPFNNATAPPLYSEINCKTYGNLDRYSCSQSSSIAEINVANTSSNADGSIQLQKLTVPKLSSEVKYYNVREKKKKRKTNSYGSNHEKSGQINDFLLNGNYKNGLSTVSFEMGENSMEKNEDLKNVLKQKRRSAPLDSNLQINVKVARSYSTSACSVIHETYQHDNHWNLHRKENNGQNVIENNKSKFVIVVNNEGSDKEVKEPPLNNERDSLLKTHSSCNSQECENFLNYDRVKYSDSDLSSIHLYQCLDDTNNISQVKQNHLQKSKSHNSL